MIFSPDFSKTYGGQLPYLLCAECSPDKNLFFPSQKKTCPFLCFFLGIEIKDVGVQMYMHCPNVGQEQNWIIKQSKSAIKNNNYSYKIYSICKQDCDLLTSNHWAPGQDIFKFRRIILMIDKFDKKKIIIIKNIQNSKEFSRMDQY